MLEQARESERRFDVILVHSFSRFYRNGAEMELTIRSLGKVGVEVVSVTQPTGDDPAQEMMRQIIGIFDEYTSRENGKNVTRAMRESARQGFWNGATPPLGYRIIEAERLGAKIKKRLEVDPVEAETVRLIYRLYIEGDGQSGPLGVKEAALDRLVVQARTAATITPDRLEAFSQLMRDKLDTADAKTRKAYLQSVIARIEVDNQKIRVFSDKAELASAVTEGCWALRSSG